MSWSECIDHGRKSASGYAALRRGEPYPLHCLVCPGWEPGLQAHHVCFNKRCINPAHLRAMTNSDHATWHHRDRHRHEDHAIERVERAGCGSICRISRDRHAVAYQQSPARRARRAEWARNKRRTDSEWRGRVRRQSRESARRKRAEAANGEG